jgi:hypothetical protein
VGTDHGSAHERSHEQAPVDSPSHTTQVFDKGTKPTPTASSLLHHNADGAHAASPVRPLPCPPTLQLYRSPRFPRTTAREHLPPAPLTTHHSVAPPSATPHHHHHQQQQQRLANGGPQLADGYTVHRGSSGWLTAIRSGSVYKSICIDEYPISDWAWVHQDARVGYGTHCVCTSTRVARGR